LNETLQYGSEDLDHNQSLAGKSLSNILNSQVPRTPPLHTRCREYISEYVPGALDFDVQLNCLLGCGAVPLLGLLRDQLQLSAMVVFANRPMEADTEFWKSVT
jgi:hypothetical protein